jgi:hypothetical protein
MMPQQHLQTWLALAFMFERLTFCFKGEGQT